MSSMMPGRIPASPERLAAFCRKWKVKELSIFGSILRDDFREDSDVDVLVETLPDSELGWDWLDMQNELASLLDRKVDLVFKDGLRNPYRRREILRTRQVLYAA
ncbi:MAG: nucleotidyltransferase family protein [Tepidisphaeraceae bacterium]